MKPQCDLAADGAIDPDSEPARVNWALRESLSEQLTRAAATTLALAPGVALAALLATLRVALRGFGATPLRLDAARAWKGVALERDLDAEIDWCAEFAAARALSVDARSVGWLPPELRTPHYAGPAASRDLAEAAE